MLNAHIATRANWVLVAGNPVPYLNSLRDSRNPAQAQRPGKLSRPRDKYGFAVLVDGNGGRAPETIALIAEGRVIAGTAGAGTTTASFLAGLPAGQYFCKPNRGSNGIGGFRLDIADGAAAIDGETKTLAAIEAVLAAQPYLVQPLLTPLQHPAMARFHPRTINTLRLITFERDAGAVAVAAAVRISSTSVAVDNWSAGGVMVPADVGCGVLGEFGIVKKGLDVVDAHPQTGLAFKGFAVPYFRDAVEMACRLHDRIDMASLGWDIALLADGPCILEANRMWDIFFAAQLNPGFIPFFLDYHLERGSEGARFEIAGPFANRDNVRMWLSEVAGHSRASAKVNSLTDTHLSFSVKGSRRSIDMAAHYLKQSAPKFAVTSIHAARGVEEIAPGFDVAATFV